MATRMTVEEFEQRLQRLPSLFPGDQTAALEECDAAILYGVEENFAASQTAQHRNWPQRKAKGGIHPLLLDTGDLYRAAVRSGEAARTITDGRKLERRVPPGASGTSVAGARRHEFGDEVILGKPGILARPYFGVSSSTADTCASTVADHLVETVMEAFA